MKSAFAMKSGWIPVYVLLAGSACGPPKKPPPEIHTGAATNITRMTQGAEDERNPMVSADGTRIAFIVRKDKQWDIFTTDADTGRNSVQVTKHPGNDYFPSWTSDGKSVLFMSDRLKGVFSIWTQQVSGTGGSVLINEGDPIRRIAYPRLSPDGQKMVYASFPNPQKPFWCIQIVAPEAGKASGGGNMSVQLIRGTQPAWSPDGKRIAYASDAAGNWDIWSVEADGTNITQLTTDPGDQRSPCYSPEGKWIAYSSNESGFQDLWIMKTDGTVPIQLTADAPRDLWPSWGTTGHIYYTSDKGGNWDIWRLTPVLPE